MSFGQLLISALLAEHKMTSLMQLGSVEPMLTEAELPQFKFVQDFIKKHGTAPTKETVEANTHTVMIDAVEPFGYYREQLEKRFTERTLRLAMKEASVHFAADAKDPQAALVILTKAIMQLIAQKQSAKIVDFRDAYDIVIPDYASKWKQPDQYGLHLGWKYFDELSGGLVRGDLTSFVGRPQKGKTFQMLYAALHGWKKQADAAGLLTSLGKPNEALQIEDQSRMFVSMEMGILPIMQRLAAIQTHTPMTKLKNPGLETPALNKLKKGLLEIQGYGAPFYVVDGNLASTVEDIALMARQLKPAAIFVDGAYLLKHPRERDRYKRAAENAELIKSELASIAPTCASWQFAKTAEKKNKKKGEKVDLTDVGYTDAIAQVSSIVLGLLEDDTIETLKTKTIEILKGRSGEVGSFKTNWSFATMNFSQVEEDSISDLSFM